jgi:peptidoglycan biosynthesis protein MviN/MurJ (putative lipid II flippase)
VADEARDTLEKETHELEVHLLVTFSALFWMLGFVGLAGHVVLVLNRWQRYQD